MNKYLIFLIFLVALIAVGCQNAPVATVPTAPEAKPTLANSEVAIWGTYKGEYSEKQTARWKAQNLQSAEVRLVLQEDGKFRTDSQFVTDTAQSVFSASGKFILEGDKLTLIAEKYLEDGQEVPFTPEPPAPVVFTVAEGGKQLISPAEIVARDLSFPDRFIKE
jgi:hypothetical protein